MHNLPSFASLERKQKYSALYSQMIRMIKTNLQYWNWTAASYITAPTLNKMFAIHEQLKFTKDIPGIIVEFGCSHGSKIRYLTHLSNLYLVQKTIVGFDSLKGYRGGAFSPGYNFDKKLFVLDPKFVIEEHKKFKEIVEQLYNSRDIHLIIDKLPEGYINSNYDGSEVSLAFFDLQDPELTEQLFYLVSKNLSVGGLIIFEGFNSPFFKQLDFLQNVISLDNWQVINDFVFEIPFSFVITRLN
jgi:hypothetical protein